MKEQDGDKSILLSHEYDGIQEYDNPLPGWWKAIFWLSFYFSIGYFFHYHISENGKNVATLYEDEVAAAREVQAKQLMGQEVTEDGLAEFMTNSGLMADAQKLFEQKCAVCHGEGGEGKIGPNLTDDHWLHGNGSLLTIHTTIRDGVPERGMAPWGRQLRPVEVRKLAAFVGTLRGTNVPGPRGPEGNKVTPAANTP